MPLANLFSKKTKGAKNIPKENGELFSDEGQMSVISEVNAVLNELVNTVSEKINSVPENIVCPDNVESNLVEQEKMDEVVEKTASENILLNEMVLEQSVSIKKSDELKNSVSEKDESNIVDEGKENSIITKSDSENHRTKTEQQIPPKIVRSASASESEIESQTKHVRKRYGSESGIISETIMPVEQQKELSEAISTYVEKLIKESIYKAVRNVNVESLYEDVRKNFSGSNCSQSTDSEVDFVVPQRLTSDSINELVELQNIEDKSRDINEEHCDSLLSNCDDKVNEIKNIENDPEDADRLSFGGYLADLEDTASVDDLKSIEGDSLNSSLCGFDAKITSIDNKAYDKDSVNSSSSYDLDNKVASGGNNSEITEDRNHGEIICKDRTVESETTGIETQTVKDQLKEQESISGRAESISEKGTKYITPANGSDASSSTGRSDQSVQNLNKTNSDDNHDQNVSSNPSSGEHEQKTSEDQKTLAVGENSNEPTFNLESNCENVSLIVLSPEEENSLLKENLKTEETKTTTLDTAESAPPQQNSEEEQKKVNWKVGNLHVKLPHKARGKSHLKAWKKRRVVIQPDEFANDPKNQSLVISIYGSDSKKHSATFWHSVSSQKAVVFRSSSHSHRYAFTISEGGEPLVHLSAENESATQEWMSEIRDILWPPSPFLELEKMLSGREFEVSIIDNEFSYRAGLLGMYGYLSITPKKLILLHPQQGFVIQEWYLNTVDKFQFVSQPKADDEHKVLCMTTCSDSSTGQGDLIFFCKEAVTLLQSLASNIHQVLSYHSKQEGGKYQKELEEIAEWLTVPPQDCLNVESSEHYKVPPRQVKSLLDIPNFIFNKSLSPVASAIFPAPKTEDTESLVATRNKPTTISQDSGFSTCTSSDDFLNCSVTSFIIGGGPLTGKSSDSEFSDAYTPPRTPEVKRKMQRNVEKVVSSTDS